MPRTLNFWMNALADQQEKCRDAESTAIRYIKIWTKQRAEVRRLEVKIRALALALEHEATLRAHVEAEQTEKAKANFGTAAGFDDLPIRGR